MPRRHAAARAGARAVRRTGSQPRPAPWCASRGRPPWRDPTPYRVPAHYANGLVPAGGVAGDQLAVFAHEQAAPAVAVVADVVLQRGEVVHQHAAGPAVRDPADAERRAADDALDVRRELYVA